MRILAAVAAVAAVLTCAGSALSTTSFAQESLPPVPPVPSAAARAELPVDGKAALEQAFDAPLGVAAAGSGRVYVVSALQNRVYLISADGSTRVIAGTGEPGYEGDGGPATRAQLNLPSAVALDNSGNLYIADTANHSIRKVSKDGNIQTIAGIRTPGFDGDGGPAVAAMLNRPFGIAVDKKGAIYVADTANLRIRKITPKGVISTLAGDGERGFAGDDGPGKAARLDNPLGIAVDDDGNLYVADSGNRRIRKITSNGKISTCACGLESSWTTPEAVSVAKDGTLYVADSGSHRVRKVTTKGSLVAVVAGGASEFRGDAGPAIAALLKSPRSLSVDKDGNIYIADSGNHRVRRIDSRGVITTIAGNGQTTRGSAQPSYPVTTAALPPQAPIRVGGDVLQANCLRCPPPEYPSEMRSRRISDVVVMTAIVGTDGHVRDVKVIRGNEILARAAVAAVYTWLYRPQSIDGEPVEVTASISISFVFR